MEIENCRGMLDRLSDYLGGELDEDICQELEEHMAGCDECRIVVDTLGKTILLYKKLPRPKMSEAARRGLYLSLDLGQYLSEQA